MMQLTIAETPGRCRWCGCTYFDPCPSGCGWANRTQTLCTACVEFDRLLRSRRGRAELVEAAQIALEDLARFRVGRAASRARRAARGRATP